MDFKTRRIRYKKEYKTLNKIWAFIKNLYRKIFHKSGVIKKKKRNTASLILAIAAIVILFFYGCGAIVSKIGIINIIGIFGEHLQTDSYGNTNVLLLGVGGGEHDGADLTDTIIVASLDQKNKLVPMLSIPRDFYVNVEEVGGGVRINSVYELGKIKYGTDEGINLVKKTIEEITGVDIHYHVLINFAGFKDVVDSLGGVEIHVDNAIHDPYYPLDGTIKYQTFSISAGLQKMDGNTALKYARSRKTTSDFDRSKRQQKLLFAIKEKAMSKNILLNPGKIKDLYYSVDANLETNLSIRHIIELAKISQHFDRDDIIARVMTDDPTSCGGFLYVPMRELFGGAYVLIPIGNNYDFIHQYVNLIFHYPQAHKNQLKIQILNGTKTPGLAVETKAILNRLCFDVIRFGNAQNQGIETTTIFYKENQTEEGQESSSVKISDALYFINQMIPGEISQEIPSVYFEPQYISEANIIIELGEDYAKNKPKDVFYKYYPSDTPKTTTTTTETEGGEEENEE